MRELRGQMRTQEWRRGYGLTHVLGRVVANIRAETVILDGMVDLDVRER